MSSYYYIQDPNSEFGYTPILGEEYVVAIFRIAKKKGFEITEKLILKELEEMEKLSPKKKS